MNKEQFLHYFYKKDKNTENAEEITVTKVVSSATTEITNGELRFAVNEINKSHGRPEKYLKGILEKVKREVRNHTLTFGTSSAIKKFSIMYPKFTFIRTSVNNWKKNWMATWSKKLKNTSSWWCDQQKTNCKYRERCC